jgi:hypothetical protein
LPVAVMAVASAPTAAVASMMISWLIVMIALGLYVPPAHPSIARE